jgi:aldehyde dehydrogenase (NAD+)
MESTATSKSPPAKIAARERLFIGGRWVDATSGRTFESTNPATGEILAELAVADAVDGDLAVAAARKAFDEGPWRKTKPAERQRLLLRLADLVDANFEGLAELETQDMGMPIARTRTLRPRALGLLRYYAGQTTSIHGDTIENSIAGEVFSYTLKEPLGVVAAITAWNGPLCAAIWKISVALAAGCTVVLKPAEQACLTTLRLARLIQEAGFPDGVVNVVTGFGDVGAALVAHPGVDKVAFTGSTETGQAIVRASAGNLKRLSLELGGKSPNIVFADADLEAAVPTVAMAIFFNSGQVCSAGSRLFVEASIHDEFVDRLAAYARTLKVGNGMEEGIDLGPLVSSDQLDRVMGYIDAGRREGARAVVGGERLAAGPLAKGWFVAPTVFGGVNDDMVVAKEEIFGPVLSAMPFTSIDEVIRRANNSPYGLGGGVWTSDIRKATRVSAGLRTGTVWINCYQAMDPAVPFGGYKMSGYGRESGRAHIDEYLHVKAVVSKIA